MIKMSPLLADLKSRGITIDKQTIHRYCKGYWEPVKGQKKYFSFYPHTLPHHIDQRGWFLFDPDVVYAWIKEHKAAYFCSGISGIEAFNQERKALKNMNTPSMKKRLFAVFHTFGR